MWKEQDGIPPDQATADAAAEGELGGASVSDGPPSRGTVVQPGQLPQRGKGFAHFAFCIVTLFLHVLAFSFFLIIYFLLLITFPSRCTLCVLYYACLAL